MDKTAFMILDKLYPQEISFLDEADPFRFLCCVLLSAQTRDDYVNAVAPGIWERWPTVQALAEADLEELETVVHPLGFYRSKARSLKALANAVLERGGEIPSSIDELVKLPGVGRKTANCYINHVVGEPAVIVDTHFARVAKRLGYAHGEDPTQIEAEIRCAFESGDWSRLSMVLNLHGRKVCHARKPECASCPVASYSMSRQ